MRRTRRAYRALSNATLQAAAAPATQNFVAEAVVVGAVRLGDDGQYATVQIMPDGYELEVRVAVAWAQGGAGDWRPVLDGDTVLVLFPGGDANSAIALPVGIWNEDEPPPGELLVSDDPPALALDRTTTGTKRRIITPDTDIDILAGATLHLTGQTKVVVTVGSSTVTVEDGTVTVKANKVVFDAPTVETGAGATESEVGGDALSTWLTTQLQVSTAFGPSGPALTGLTSAQLSSVGKVKL